MKLTFLNTPVNQANKDAIVPGADCYACHGGCCGTNNGRSDETLDNILEKNENSSPKPKI